MYKFNGISLVVILLVLAVTQDGTTATEAETKETFRSDYLQKSHSAAGAMKDTSSSYNDRSSSVKIKDADGNESERKLESTQREKSLSEAQLEHFDSLKQKKVSNGTVVTEDKERIGKDHSSGFGGIVALSTFHDFTKNSTKA